MEAFRQASLKGWAYAVRHPEVVIQVICEKYSQNLSQEALSFDAAETLPLIKADQVHPTRIGRHEGAK